MQVQGFSFIALDISDFPTRHNYGLALWQSHFERILADWVAELRVPILRGCEVVGIAPDDSGVDVELSGDMTLRAEYLVGCDGGRSLIRKAAGIDFPGLDPSTSWMIAEVEMDEEPELGFRRDSVGQHALGRRAAGEPIRVVLTERHVDHTGDPSMGELREALVAVYGTDYGLRSANWISRFTDMSRQAAAYRHGRVLLAGDAAHVHPPQGGQGLNTGVQDAVNLGWKLAQVVNETSPDSLLDTYHAERHPVGARVLRNTMAQVALSQPRRPPRGSSRHHGRTVEHGRAAQEDRRDAVRSRHPLRPRGGTPAARAAHARSRLAHRGRSHRACSRCCTTPGPSSSTSLNPAVSTSRHGPLEFRWSRQNMLARGSFRCWARSRLLRPC